MAPNILASQTAKKSVVYAADFAIVSSALPFALWLTDGAAGVFSTVGVLVWLGLSALSILMLHLFRVYSSLWRFASTRDFMNIAMASLGGLALAVTVVGILTLTGVEPPFSIQTCITYFLLTAAGIATMRLAFRLISDRNQRSAPASQQANSVFLGTLEDASMVARHLARHPGRLPALTAILATDLDRGRSRISNIPVEPLPDFSRPGGFARDLGLGSHTTAIIGRSGFDDNGRRIELIRQLRAHQVRILEFAGVCELSSTVAPDTEKTFTEIDVANLIQRGETRIDADRLAGAVGGKRIMITGGAGSIGSQLARRCLTLGATQVVIVDRWEAGVFELGNDLSLRFGARFKGHVADICDGAAMRRIFRTERPQIVFHAAAMKHVPIADLDWASAVRVNMIGTLETARIAREFNVDQFVFVSTDKAVDPTTFLGWTKRFGEIVCTSMTQARDADDADRQTRFLATRFGNVFASTGSVVEVFNRQIAAGRAVTVTDPRMKRFFMTGQEASDLVILATELDASRTGISSGIYALEMGEQVSILELARSLIKLAGKEPEIDVPIEFVGIRANEKLQEALVSDSETALAVLDEGVIEIGGPAVSEGALDAALGELGRLVDSGSRDDAIALVQAMEAGARGGAKIVALEEARAKRLKGAAPGE